MLGYRSCSQLLHISAYALILLAFLSVPSLADPPKRVVSINLCADQALLALADRDQILAVTRNALDPDMSFHAKRAKGLRTIGGRAEEVLKLKPDLVLASAYTSDGLVRLLHRHGLRVHKLIPGSTIEAARRQLLDAARILGHPARGASLDAAIDEALAMARQNRGSERLTAAYYQRRGILAGKGLLVHDLMTRFGINDYATRFGGRPVRHLPLEVLVSDPPDILIVSDRSGRPADQGQAVIAHPALARAVPPHRRIVLPQRQTICPAFSLAAAIRSFAGGLRAVAGEKNRILQP